MPLDIGPCRIGKGSSPGRIETEADDDLVVLVQSRLCVDQVFAADVLRSVDEIPGDRFFGAGIFS